MMPEEILHYILTVRRDDPRVLNSWIAQRTNPMWEQSSNWFKRFMDSKTSTLASLQANMDLPFIRLTEDEKKQE